MERIFVGSAALARGDVNRYALGKHYRRLLPDVYGPRCGPLTLEDRTTAAWLWSRREGVIAGLAASAALGAKWVDADVPIELIWANNRPPAGILTSRDDVADGEIVSIAGMPVTTAERTAFDLARRGPVGKAVERLDALARATQFKVGDVQAVARRHPRARGLSRLDQVLDLVDEGAESPRETWLRLLLINAGYPRPETQIPIFDSRGYPLYYLDLGWQEPKIAVEYDGQHHRERTSFGRDIVRSEYVSHLRWRHIRVVAGDRPTDILHRVGRAWASR